jgi:hypothetical protein
MDEATDYVRGIYLDYTNADHTAGNLYAIDINNISQDADATEYALHLGSGWDAQLALLDTSGSDYYTTFTTGSQAADIAYTLPTAIGANQYLRTDASGILTWDTPTGAGDITDVGDADSGATFTEDGPGNTLYFEGTAANTEEIALVGANPDADRTITLPNASGTVAVSATLPISLDAAGDISIGQSGAGADGYLDQTDWNTFNDKLTSTLTDSNIFVGNGSDVATGVAMSGDINIANDGATTIQPDSVALTTDTAGDYVASFTAGAGLTGDASGEGATPTLAVVAADTTLTVNADNMAVNQAHNFAWTGNQSWDGTMDSILVNPLGGSADALTFSGSLEAMDEATDYVRGIYLDYTNADHTQVISML